MLSLLAVVSALAFAPPDGPPKGHLVILGGGSTTEHIRQKALALAGGTKARVLLVPHASGDPQAGPKMAEAWRGLAEDVEVLRLEDPEAARAQIGRADLIWMRGGNQNRLMDALRQA